MLFTSPFFIPGMCSRGIAYYLSLYLGTSTPLTKLQIGQVGSIVGFGALSGALCSTYITDKLSSKNIIIISFFFLGLSFFSYLKALIFWQFQDVHS